MSASTSPPVSHEPRRLAALWAGWLTGPVVWLVLLEYNYALSYVACETRQTWFMHLGIGVALVAVASAGWFAWRAGQASQGDADVTTHPLSDETRLRRNDWMSLCGVGISVLFVLVIIAMEVPLLVLKECQ
jgi:hypothetical protein